MPSVRSQTPDVKMYNGMECMLLPERLNAN
jgi:hypothetical protein